MQGQNRGGREWADTMKIMNAIVLTLLLAGTALAQETAPPARPKLAPTGPTLRATSLSSDVDAQVGTPVHLSFQVLNQGEADVFQVPMSLLVDGQEVLHKVFYETIPAKGGSLELSFSYVPKAAGRHRYAVVLGPSGTAPPPTKLGPGASAQILVKDRPGFSLGIVSCDLPPQVHVGEERVIVVVVKNSGDQVAQDVKVSLLLDGVRSASGRLQAGLGPDQTAPVELHWFPSSSAARKVELRVEGQGISKGERVTSQALKVEILK